MSELEQAVTQEEPEENQDNPETPVDPPTTPSPPVSTSVLNLAVESVMDMIDGLNLFAKITRGALGIGNSLSCEIAPSVPSEVYLDKGCYIPLTLAINGKHSDTRLLSDTLNNIMDSLSRKTSYTSGTGWEIVDISSGNLPRAIGREGNNQTIMACDLIVKIYRKDSE